MRIEIAPASDWDLVRELFREYQEEAAAPVCFTSFDQELARLPDGYAGVLLARVDGAAAGCVAWREIEPGIVEMKRLYVRSAHRGCHLGERLVLALIEASRGAERIRLDTLPHMEAAIRLYRRLGFHEISRYNDIPESGALFFERELRT